MFNQIVWDALETKSGGEEVLEEYQKTKTLKHSTRRQLVNIVVSHMTEIHGFYFNAQMQQIHTAVNWYRKQG